MATQILADAEGRSNWGGPDELAVPSDPDRRGLLGWHLPAV